MQGTGSQGVAVAPTSQSGITTTRRVLLAGVVGIIAVAALLFFLHTVGPILSFDGKSYAQIARQIARGQGMTSKVIGRVEMTDRDLDPSQWRNRVRPPAPVYMEAWMFRLAGVNDLAATLWPAMFSVATAVMIFWFAEPLFGAAIAFVSGVAFALSPTGLMYPAAGLTEPAAMFLLIVSVVLLLRFRTAWAAALIGLSMALCALTRPVAYLWTVVLLAAWIWRAQAEGRRWIAAVAALGISFLAPLLLVSHLVHWEGGRLLLAINLAWRTNGSLQEALRSPTAFVLHHPGALARKVFIELGRVGAYAFRFGNVLLFSPLALFGLAMRRTEPPVRLARALILSLLLSNALALSVLNEGDAFAGPLRYFDVFVPLLLPWGVAAVWLLRDRTRRPVFVALLTVMLAGSAVHLVAGRGLGLLRGTLSLGRQWQPLRQSR